MPTDVDPSATAATPAPPATTTAEDSNARPATAPHDVCETPRKISHQLLFGIPIHVCTTAEAVQSCLHAVETNAPVHIGCVNAAKIVKMRRDSLLRDSVLSSDLILADGIAVVWASRVLGRPLPERVTGIDLFTNLLAAAAQRQQSIYLLGATPDVLAQLITRITTEYPGVRIAGSHHGYFNETEEADIARDISAAGADYLFVGITSPKKERFLAQWQGQLDVRVCHGVGGSFDVLAGAVRRACGAWQRLGLEWLFRLLQEPRRLWKRYLVTNTKFLLLLLGEVFRRIVGRA
ncbi:MAG: WecB/TagA/CpsF family glycosyltransferase [Planctomycetota bacterium]